MSEERLSGDAIAERVIRLGRSLQARGVEVALSELVDAGLAATMIDLGSREELRVALRATMVKHRRHYPQFDAAFDRLFPARPAGERPAASARAVGQAAELVASADDLTGLATEMVDEFGAFEGELRGEKHHLHRIYRGADLAQLMSDARRADPEMATDELRARIEQLKRLIAEGVRAHLGEPETVEMMADLEDVEFLHTSRAELDQIRESIRPLARKLAARLERRRQSQHTGRINLRRTTRRSLTTGGVPMDISYERPKAHRPELYVLCDISGSVAEFSLFTLTLMAALSAEVSRTRSFVFVDAVDEITDLLKDTEHGIEPWQIMRNTDVIGDDGHSDYGAVLDQFWQRVGVSDLKPTSTVLITGDARTNYRSPRADVLGQIAKRCRRVYWLNPEARDEWDTHDSEIGTYGRSCTEVFEVRNLRQLMTCVEHIL